VKALYEAGFDDLGRIDERVARPVAEHVVREFCAEENEVIATEERAPIVEAILNEALRGS
jgi:TPP-dependent indolepyruvate ferredoxin oxidoreductase alpha subunit